MRRAIVALEASLGPLRQQARFRRLLPELSPFPGQTRERLEQLEADPAFCKLPDGKLQWRDDYDLLTAGRLAQPPRLDGDFGKWQGTTLYTLNQEAQGDDRDKSRSGVQWFSVRVGLGWDEQYLYVGVDVKDRDLYQPFFGRGIQDGDAFILTLETAFRKDFLMGHRHGNLYPLYFSPGISRVSNQASSWMTAICRRTLSLTTTTAKSRPLGRKRLSAFRGTSRFRRPSSRAEPLRRDTRSV